MTDKSKKQVEACRFCWMCRHVCPIGSATGQERDSSRARALALSMVERGTVKMEEVVDNLYECAECGGCTRNCATGWDPLIFLRESKLNAAMDDILPPDISRLLAVCLETGNAYGGTETEQSLREAIKRHESHTDTLLFLGVDARYKVPQAAVSAICVLEKAGVDFTVLADEPASGQQMDYLTGASAETVEQMKACAMKMNEFSTVILYDPQDAMVVRRRYGEWKVGLRASAQTFTAFLEKLTDAGKLQPPETVKAISDGERVPVFAYQDPFQLARELEETEEARKVIRCFAGDSCREMILHGKDTMWAGNLLMREWMPEVMRQVARNRIQNALKVGANTIVTASVSEYASLRDAAIPEVRIVSIEELILASEKRKTA